jgi:hypothetical protein
MMPAYRSNAEGEVREAVVAHLRSIRPRARIIHEINCSSYGPNRIDVLAVSPADIVAVEIKSSKDKLDRLPAQIASMKACAHHVFAALHEKHLRPFGQDGKLGVMVPDEARGAIVWAFPRVDRKGHVECSAEWFERDRWEKPKLCLPPAAIHLLWREELQAICASLGINGVTKINMPEAIDAVTWRLSGEQITRIICATLRARRCVEADPEIAEAA